MNRTTGIYTLTTTVGEPVRAFVPHALPPANPPLAPEVWQSLNAAAVTALQRLSAVAGLVPSVDWLLYSAIRQEALLTSQIEGTQATLVDLFDEEAGLAISNTDDVEEVTNYLRAFQWVQAQLRSPTGLPISVRLLSEAHRLLLNGARGAGKQPVNCAARRTGLAAHAQAMRCLCRRLPSGCRGCWATWSDLFTPKPLTCRPWCASRWCMRSLKPSTLIWMAMVASGAC